MMDLEEIEDLLYTDTELRQQMEQYRRQRLRANRPTRNSEVTLTGQSGGHTLVTAFPEGIERRSDLSNL
jgi:hypothetical protein